MSVNKVILVGNLGADPEIRFTQSNIAVATMSLATSETYLDRNRNKVESTEWHRVIAWGRLAEVMQQYGFKGMKLYVEGKIETKKWTDKNGVERWSTEIKAVQIQMLSKRQDGASADQGTGYSGPTSALNDAADKAQSLSVEDMTKDDDLPF